MAGKRIYHRISIFIFPALLFFATPPSFAQWGWNNRVSADGDGVFMGGAGMAFIDGESYYALNLRTDLALGKFGLGVDIPLRFNTTDGELRDEDWDTTYDYMRAIRYVRYGQKRRDPVYAKLGTLDGVRLGHGFIMNYYTNEAEYDDRKIGSEFDLKFKTWGIETIVSNYDRIEITGARAYVLPLRNMENLLLLKNLTFGGTIISDRDPDESELTKDRVTVAGVDLELPLLQKGPFFTNLYTDFAKIDDYGSGAAVGVELGLWKLGGLVSLKTRLERRFLGKEFLPNYFDAFYEVEKTRIVDTLLVRKTDLLAMRTSGEQGYYGELLGHVLKVIRLLGTFERIDGQPESGRLHLGALLSKALPRISARGMYDKTGIQDFGDAFSLDERAILRAGFGYQINSYLYLFADYIWTFRRDKVTSELRTQRRVEPQLTFVMPLNFGG